MKMPMGLHDQGHSMTLKPQYKLSSPIFQLWEKVGSCG